MSESFHYGNKICTFAQGLFGCSVRVETRGRGTRINRVQAEYASEARGLYDFFNWLRANRPLVSRA